MKLLLVRHGEADYSIVALRHHLGMGFDMAKLSDRGIEQAKAVANSPLFKDAEIIISSPYTRAMETAAYIQRVTGLDLLVENDLHEWSPDLTYKRRRIYFNILRKEMRDRNGIWDESCKYKWEEFHKMGERAFNCLKKYIGKYNKVIVVAHGYVFNQFIFNPVMQNCEIEEYELTMDSKPLGYIDPYPEEEQ